MNVSIVTAVLNSHEIVRRQLLHYMEQKLPEDVEVIIVDDGSKPAQKEPYFKLNYNFRFVYTNDFRDWTQPAARNFGVREAVGEYIIVTDIDHILTKELIEEVRKQKWDVYRFRREFAIIDERGQFVQNKQVLMEYGLPEGRIERRGFNVTPHTNSFAMRRDLYWEIGGVSEKRVGLGVHPHREEQPVKKAYKRLAQEGKITLCGDDDRPTIYLIPNGRFCGDKDYNPFGLFHNLKRMTR